MFKAATCKEQQDFNFEGVSSIHSVEEPSFEPLRVNEIK